MESTVPPGEAQETGTLRWCGPSPPLHLLELITRLASELTSAPISVIAVMDGERAWKTCARGVELNGVSLPSAMFAETSPFSVADARQDFRFASHPLITGRSAVRAIAGVPLFAADGLPFGVLCVMDRRERRFQADELRLLERVASAVLKQFPAGGAGEDRVPRLDTAAWRSAIASVALGVAVLDQGGRFLDANPSYCRITGYRQEEMAGHAIAELLPPGGPESARLARAIAREACGDPAGRACATGEYCIVRKDGSRADVRLTIGLLQDGTSSRVVTMEDVTALKRTDAQLRNAEKLDAVSRLAGGVAHSVNNLLTIIAGYGQLLRDVLKGGGPAQDYLEEIAQAAGAATLLTTRLLAFGRWKVGEPELLDLSVLVRETAAFSRSGLPAGIVLVTEHPADLLPVLADRASITQALRELLVNACEAMPGGGRIWVRTANPEPAIECAAAVDGLRPGRYVLLQVEDEGEGMDPEALKHLFEPFYSTKAAGRGTGLATVYGTVRQCGGDVKVSSLRGRGTVAALFFPVA